MNGNLKGSFATCYMKEIPKWNENSFVPLLLLWLLLKLM